MWITLSLWSLPSIINTSDEYLCSIHLQIRMSLGLSALPKTPPGNNMGNWSLNALKLIDRPPAWPAMLLYLFIYLRHHSRSLSLFFFRRSLSSVHSFGGSKPTAAFFSLSNYDSIPSFCLTRYQDASFFSSLEIVSFPLCN